MKSWLKSFVALAFSLWITEAVAQDAEMADAFRAEGKIYVVVAIVLIVLAGLITYLFMLDRKMTRLEKMLQEKKQTKTNGKSF